MGEIFLEDAKKLGVEFYEGEAVAFEKKENSWSVSFENGEVVEAKTVIYGAGAKHRPLGLPEEADYAGKGISYCAICDGAFYKGKTAVVVGGGDTALDDALYLSDICTRVYLVHRRDEFRGSARTLQKIREKENITVITNAVITAVSGEKKVEEVTLNNGTKLKTDGVFVAVGMIPHTEHLKDFLELDTQGYVVADETGKTSQDGFFVAGDVRTKHLRQVITAVADGANAAYGFGIYPSVITYNSFTGKSISLNMYLPGCQAEILNVWWHGRVIFIKRQFLFFYFSFIIIEIMMLILRYAN